MSSELREKLYAVDWKAAHAEGKTKFLVEPSWFASEKRCELLRRLCTKYKATRVLEIGACCGLASLAMAEVLPEAGEVVALEIDPYLAEFGQLHMKESPHGKKVNYVVGPAMDSLKTIAKDCFDGKIQPFDFLLIDADRAGMMDYFNIFWWESPNMLAKQATVCIDITPYKGQTPELTRGPSQQEVWVVPSGQDQIDSLRRTLEASTEHSVYQVAGLLVSHSRVQKEEDNFSNVSTPRRVTPGGPWQSPQLKGGAVKGSPSLTYGYNPLAAFPNQHVAGVGGARWVPPKPSDVVSELRKKVKGTNWGDLYTNGKTLTRVDPEWCCTEERCGILRKLVHSTGAKSVLEVGGFCGVSTLSIAEELPADGCITSLEVDPFLVEFGSEILAKSPDGSKIKSIVGPAKQSLETLAKKAGDNPSLFDFVVVDADRDNLNDYFKTIWNSPGLLKKGSTVCVDVQPYKGQAPIRYVKAGKAPDAEQWILPAGREKVDELKDYLAKSARFSSYKVCGMLVVTETGLPDLTI